MPPLDAPAAQICADGVLLFVRVTPKSSKDEIAGLITREGRIRLRVKVRAVPEDGKANTAVADLIAKSLQLKGSAVSVAAGHKDRDKTILIVGAQLNLVETWLREGAREREED